MYIPEDLIEDVEKITQALIKYKNPKKLSWLRSYEDVLKQLGMEDRIKENRLLSYVVRRISDLFYIIEPDPFKLLTDNEFYETLNKK